MQYTKIPGGICAPKGFKAAGVHCGIRNNPGKLDLALITCDVSCSAAATYTQNKVKGAPLVLTERNLLDGTAKGILCNSGNANTCNPNGLEIANACCQLAADATSLDSSDFIIASTGVIGQPLSLEPFQKGIPEAAKQLSASGGAHAAEAIMTTDTKHKEFAYSFTLGGKTCHIGAIGKGSGMINPNMATMLVFITTDAAISPAMLNKALKAEIQQSFNQICVDGDTSTNDMVTAMASGLCGNSEITTEDSDYAAFCAALHKICVKMSRAIASDGEGATKLVECHVSGAPDVPTARAIAKSVISSDLCKAAMFGEDANWGRVLCAIGYTPGAFDISKTTLTIKSTAGAVKVCENAAYYPFSEEEAAKILGENEIQLLVDLHDGDGTGTAWGCDLTYDYVRINGDYRT